MSYPTPADSQGFASLILSLNELAARFESLAVRLERALAGAAVPTVVTQAPPQLDGSRPPAPMSKKQGNALFALSNGQKNWKIDDLCNQVFGKTERHLNSREASQLIDGLKNGSIVPGQPQTAGIEAVITAFPGAAQIGYAGQYGQGQPLAPGEDPERPF